MNKSRTLCLLSLIAFSIIQNLTANTKTCDEVLSSSTKFSGKCTMKWKLLKEYVRPTQMAVGYAWIKYKVDKDFQSKDDAQKKMDESLTPAVLGLDNYIYIVDDHHTLAALDYSSHEDVIVTMEIICDKRGRSTDAAFWKEMASDNLVYLASHPQGNPNALPVSISYRDLPSTFSFTSSNKSFADDPWRSLVSFSRKVSDAPAPAPACSSSDDKYCERCMFRGCDTGWSTQGPGIPFFEFRYSYFFNDALYNDTYWPSKESYNTFLASYKQITPQYPSRRDNDNDNDIDKINPTQWLETSSLLIPLCRSKGVAIYNLPIDLFPDMTCLPGFAKGYEKLDADPTCAMPTCT